MKHDNDNENNNGVHHSAFFIYSSSFSDTRSKEIKKKQDGKWLC